MVDELTHFSAFQYKFLRGRCRVGGLPIPEDYSGQFRNSLWVLTLAALVTTG